MFQLPHAIGVRIIEWAIAAALMLAGAPLVALAQATSGAPATQSSVDRGVTVKVTPKTVGASDGRWEFSVVFDTHSADLSDDLVQSASLATDDGRTLKPADWTGAAPGGHHREGVLAFDVPAPRPTSIELRIIRPGESGPRTFRWQL
ncbi:MAG: hypothetical protein HYX43_04105 [Burkholderiales bacterium]|nr:hypothetical protein [Burkholderiales bacterium]